MEVKEVVKISASYADTRESEKLDSHPIACLERRG